MEEALVERHRRAVGDLAPLEEIVRASMLSRHLRGRNLTWRCAPGEDLHMAIGLTVSFADGRPQSPLPICRTALRAHAQTVRNEFRMAVAAGGMRMDFGQAMLQAGPGRSESFALFAQSLDQRWIEQALQATGSATVRRRKLPAEYVAWIVIGMGLLRDRSIHEVVHHLALVVPGLDPPHSRQTVTGGAWCRRGIGWATKRCKPYSL